MGIKDGMGTGNRQVDPAKYHFVVNGRNKVGHVFQQLMDVMKEEGKLISGTISVKLNRRN